MKGKDRCKILKDIRRRIAEENNIEFITSECKHKGDCLGTCPKCESELRYLEKELEARRRLGKTVTVAGLALSVTLAASSCIPDLFDKTTNGDLLSPQSSSELFNMKSDGELIGAPAESTPDLWGETEPILSGELPYEEVIEFPGELPEESVIEESEPSDTEADTPAELMGDIAV